MGYENLSSDIDELKRIAQMLGRRIDEKERERNVLVDQLDHVNAKLRALTQT